MGPSKNYLILRKDEWKRLKNKGSSIQTNKAPPDDEYIKSLIEKSQNWIKAWPDTVQGHIRQVEKQKKKQHLKDIAFIKHFKMKRNTDRTTKSIENAKQMIFDDTCYGRRLLSALIESKTLEERDVQIEFQKQLTENAKALERKDDIISTSLQNVTDMEKHEKELVKRKREICKEVAQMNKSMFLAQNEIKACNEKKRKQMELEDLRIIKELIEKETLEKLEKKIRFRKDLDETIAVRKEIEQRKVEREYEDERRAKFWRNYEDSKRHKMEMILNKRLMNMQQFTKHYELINKLEKEKISRYNDFVNSGLNTLTIREPEQDDNHKREKDREFNYLIMESNKKLAETKRISECNQNKCTCDRQSIIMKSKGPCVKGNTSGKDIPKFTPTNFALIKNVRQNEKEPTPWNGLSAAHTHFAQQANKILQECRYKNIARKVVDDYRKSNCLNSETLPVPNYF